MLPQVQCFIDWVLFDLLLYSIIIWLFLNCSIASVVALKCRMHQVEVILIFFSSGLNVQLGKAFKHGCDPQLARPILQLRQAVATKHSVNLWRSIFMQELSETLLSAGWSLILYLSYCLQLPWSCQCSLYCLLLWGTRQWIPSQLIEVYGSIAQCNHEAFCLRTL